MSKGSETPKTFLVSNGSQTVDRQVQSHFERNSLSPWLNAEHGTPRRDDVIQRTIRSIPPRSVSTFNFRDAKDKPKIQAAPFPMLPTKREVQEVKNSMDNELQMLRADLSSLTHELSSCNRSSRPLIPTDSTQGIREYRGLLITENTIDEVLSENKNKRLNSIQSSALKTNPPLYHNIFEFPFYHRMIQTQEKNVVPLFSSQYSKRANLLETRQELARIYVDKYKYWKDVLCKEIDDYNSRTDEKSEVWPPEFASELPKVDDAIRVKWCAQDQPMLLSERDKEAECYWNTNGFVEDPVAEHNKYRARLCWTEEERITFVEKYRQHPKDFRKIAAALPEKTHKDVIEFYYVNRYELSLRENEGAAKKRGAKKKVMSEGSTKKNY